MLSKGSEGLLVLLSSAMYEDKVKRFLLCPELVLLWMKILYCVIGLRKQMSSFILMGYIFIELVKVRKESASSVSTVKE